VLLGVVSLSGCGGGNKPPSVSIDTPQDKGTLRELDVRFSGSGTDPEGKALTYAWDFGDGQTGAEASLTHSYAKGGQYNVSLTATDEGKKAATASTTITVNDPPHTVATIKSDDSAGAALKFASGPAPLALTFDGSGTTDSDGTVFSYAWDFGDGNASDLVAPQHTFARPGEYTVTLTVTDNLGAISKDEINVSVAEPLTPTPTESPSTQTTPNNVHIVRMVTDGANNYFDPPLLTIQPGDTVRWVDEGGVHSTTSYSPDNQRSLGLPEGAQGWDSGLLTETGASFEITFTEKGTYAYFCLPHEALGMVGVVVVGDGQPSLSQDFLNSLPSDAAREAFAKQLGLGTGGVVHTVNMLNDDGNYHFEPAVLKVEPGDTITWVNVSGFPHTVTSYDPDHYGKGQGIPEGAAGWDSGMLMNGGDTWSYTVPEGAPAGTYAYFCLPHEGLGMVGLILVEEYTPLGEAFVSTMVTDQAKAAMKDAMEQAANLK